MSSFLRPSLSVLSLILLVTFIVALSICLGAMAALGAAGLLTGTTFSALIALVTLVAGAAIHPGYKAVRGMTLLPVSGKLARGAKVGGAVALISCTGTGTAVGPLVGSVTPGQLRANAAADGKSILAMPSLLSRPDNRHGALLLGKGSKPVPANSKAASTLPDSGSLGWIGIDGRDGPTFTPELGALRAGLGYAFPKDVRPHIIDAVCGNLVTTNPGDEVAVVIEHSSAPIAAVVILDAVTLKPLFDEPLWIIGSFNSIRYLPTAQRLMIAGISNTAHCFIPELAGIDELWASVKRVNRATDVVLCVSPQSARGMVGPIPTAAGPELPVGATPPVPAEIDWMAVRIPQVADELSFFGATATFKIADAPVPSSPEDLQLDVRIVRHISALDARGADNFRTALFGGASTPNDAFPIIFRRIDDLRFIARVAQKTQELMRCSADEDEIRRDLLVQTGIVDPADRERAGDVVHRMFCPLVINNLTYAMIQGRTHLPSVLSRNCDRIMGWIRSGAIPPAKWGRAWNTAGTGYACAGEIDKAIPALRESLECLDASCAIDSLAMLVICTSHTGQAAERAQYGARLVDALQHEERSTSRWVKPALDLLAKPVLTVTGTTPGGGQTLCPACPPADPSARRGAMAPAKPPARLAAAQLPSFK